jgi:hypothetical protein
MWRAGEKRDMRPRFWRRFLKEQDSWLSMSSLEDSIKMYVKGIKLDVVEIILLVSVGTSACMF